MFRFQEFKRSIEGSWAIKIMTTFFQWTFATPAVGETKKCSIWKAFESSEDTLKFKKKNVATLCGTLF